MFSLCIPTYNRVFETLESFSLVIDNPNITEIIIRDDGSDIKMYNKLQQKIDELKTSKIKLYRSETNMGAFVNKYEAVRCASQEWIILLDSDNQINDDYIQTLLKQKLEKNTVYMPSVAKCSSQLLNYTEFAGQTFNKTNFANMLRNKKFEILFNTGNYCFNRSIYLNAYNLEAEKEHPYGVDVYYINYLMLKNNIDQNFYVVPNLTYEHRLSSDSYWSRTSTNSENFKLTLNKIIKNWK